MSCDAPAEKKEDPPPQPHRPQQTGNGNGVAAGAGAGAGGRPSTYGDRRLRLRLRLNPNKEHKPERYDDVQTEFDPCIFSSLEWHFPPSMLEVPRDAMVQFMREIFARYLPEGERTRVQRHRQYRNRILTAYKMEREGYKLEDIQFPLATILNQMMYTDCYQVSHQPFTTSISGQMMNTFANMDRCISTANIQSCPPQSTPSADLLLPPFYNLSRPQEVGICPTLPSMRLHHHQAQMSILLSQNHASVGKELQMGRYLFGRPAHLILLRCITGKSIKNRQSHG